MISECLFVATDYDEELPQTRGTDTFISKKDLACGSKKLKLSPHAVEISWNLNRLFQQSFYFVK